MNVSKATLVKVIVFAALAALMTVALGVKLANSRLFAKTYTLSAEFEDATGVLRGDAVKLAGVDVGRVEGAEIDHGKAVVTFNIDKDVKLAQDSTVAIRWRNVLGQRFLYVYPGSGDDYYEEDDVIPVANTEDVNDIGVFLNRLGPVLKAIDPDEANAFIDSVNTALTGNEGAVRQLLKDGAKLATTLGDEDERIKGLLKSADTVTAAYASQDQKLGQIFDDLDDVGVVLARRIDDVNSLVTNFSVVQRQLDGLLTRNKSNIDASLDSLDTVASTLANNRRNLAETLKTLPLGTAGYYQTSSWGEFFNVRLVALTFQSPDSEFVAVQRENDDQHADSGGSPAVGHGANNGYTKDSDGDDQAPKGKGGGSKKGGGRTASPGGSEDISAILRFALLGGGSR